MIVCGDHGMKDSGGHGGATPEETRVPFLAIGANCPSNNSEPTQIDQIDIAATLAMMLGIPLPSSNLGSVSMNLINRLPDDSKLFRLYYNAKNINEHFQKIPEYQLKRQCKHSLINFTLNYFNN